MGQVTCSTLAPRSQSWSWTEPVENFSELSHQSSQVKQRMQQENKGVPTAFLQDRNFFGQMLI